MADTPDSTLNNHHTPDPDFAAFPPEYQSTHARLARDGERWRRHIPDGQAALARARAGRGATAPSMMTHEPDRVKREARRPTFQGLQEPMDTLASPQRARWRAMAGAVAAVVLVSLLATLLIHNFGSRGEPSVSSVYTPLPTGSVTIADGTYGFVTIAPSNPNIVYVVASGKLKRSTDGGRTFHVLSVPAITPNIPNPSVYGVVISPLNSARIFLSIGGPAKNPIAPNGTYMTGLCSNLGAASSSIASSDNGSDNAPVVGAILSGQPACNLWFYSSDGGGAWTPLPSLPNGASGGFAALQAQGQRLYMPVQVAAQGSRGPYAPNVTQVAASDDDGVSWKLIGNTPNSSAPQLYGYDFAVAPTGTTIYAVYVVPDSNTPPNMWPLWLYRSDDSGRTWVKIRQLPDYQQSSLYTSATGALYWFAPTTGMSPSGFTVSQREPNDALVSLDRGVTFSRAPLSGIPTGDMVNGPLGTLSNGAVIYQAFKPNQYGNPTSFDGLYAWKPGQASWNLLYQPQNPQLPIISLTVTRIEGGDVLSGVTQQGTPDGNVTTIITQRVQE